MEIALRDIAKVGLQLSDFVGGYIIFLFKSSKPAF